MNTILIIDTNVLLSDPQALFVYPEAEIIVPQTVLTELDKIKMARNDREVRFRGREVSRILFELSEHSPLLEGVALDNNAIVKVSQYDAEDFPAALNPKNADDRILGSALQARKKHPDARVILLTNDLNMLLKAQTLGIEVQRHESPSEPTVLNRFLNKMGRKRLPLAWIAIPVILASVLIGLWFFRVPSPIPQSASSHAFQGTSFALREVQYLNVVKKDPRNYSAWFQLGQLYLDWGEQLKAGDQFNEAREKHLKSLDAFARTLEGQPNNAPAKTSMGTAHFLLGNSNEAVSLFMQAINDDPNYASAYFNLGFILFNHFRDFDNAGRAFEAYLKIENQGQRSNYARDALLDIEQALEAAH
jgi:rRNA-processing protein FCF1